MGRSVNAKPADRINQQPSAHSIYSRNESGSALAREPRKRPHQPYVRVRPSRPVCAPTGRSLERRLRRRALFFGRSLAECPGSRRAGFRELFPRTQGKEKATASSGLRCRPIGTWRETTREDARKYNDYQRQKFARKFRRKLKTLSLVTSAHGGKCNALHSAVKLPYTAL